MFKLTHEEFLNEPVDVYINNIAVASIEAQLSESELKNAKRKAKMNQ